MTAKQSILFCLLFFTVTGGAKAQEKSWKGPVPVVADKMMQITEKFKSYDVVLKPDKNEPEYWVGASSVVRDKDGIFWMAARMRSPEYPRGLRGFEIRILKSTDGIHFEKVHSINRGQVPIPGFERPALIIDPLTGKFRLYACGPWKEGPWSIIRFDDAESPDKIDPSTARPVIMTPAKTYPRDVSVTEYKDPVIFFAAGKYHCFVTGYIRQNERIFHFTSGDGDTWQPVGDINQPVMDLTGWHNFFVRPSSVLPLGVGYLFVYEGSSTQWYDPVYNIVTGLGFSFDLNEITDLTSESPLILSTTPGDFYTWRYSHWLWVNNEIWIYAEVANPNQTHEIRLFRIKMNDFQPLFN